MLIVIRKKWIFLSAAILIISFSWYMYQLKATQETGGTLAEDTLTIHMVTNEIKTKTDDGTEIESYRWDPGTVFVPVNQHVKLSIYGVNGKEHPFYIEGTDIEGKIEKGKETILDLHFTKKGVYRLICTTHSHINHDGPMVAYIVVN
jgi:heme/copper-type cytochrome/quinol oxidase subunit 2